MPFSVLNKIIGLITLSILMVSGTLEPNTDQNTGPIVDFPVITELNQTHELLDNSTDKPLESPMSIALNQSQPNVSVSTNITFVRKFSCLLEEVNSDIVPTFQILNGSTLLSLLKQNPNITSRSQAAPCQIILFYAPWCPFSVQAAPHLNALPRGFPMLRFYAIDAHVHNSLSTLQGVMAIPSLFLFHNGKAAARYNETEYKVDLFGAFITRYTGIEPIGILNRTSADYVGPLPTVVVETTDPWLILSWIVLFLSIIYWFTRSNFFWSLIENIRNTWREAEAQHEHAD